jgi:hypothetical protein
MLGLCMQVVGDTGEWKVYQVLLHGNTTEARCADLLNCMPELGGRRVAIARDVME